MNPVVNDFTIKIATVNGSGSQTANHVLMKCFFKMNIPVGAKNFFPSNIQGMATWFTIRVNGKGFVGAKEKSDILINYNPKTLPEDVASMSPEAVLFYDQDAALPEGLDLKGRTAFPIPYKKLMEDLEVPIKYRKLTSNMIYVGVVSAFLKIPEDVLLNVLEEQFNNKATALTLNQNSALKGREYFAQTFSPESQIYQAQGLPFTKQKVLMDGNTASAMGLLYGGCSFVSWYPITPSTSVIETYKEFTQKFRSRDEDNKSRDVIVQAEDELSAICMVLGAGWAGARAMTATSGPGLSLMAEAAGYAYYAEIPAVIWDVQRTGPSTGLPTRTSQGDITFAHFLSHGDTKHVCLFPGTLAECFEFGQTCFDLAERLQTLIVVLSDLDLGMNVWAEEKWAYPERPYDRGKIVTLEDLEKGLKFERYKDVDGDGIPQRTLPGTPHINAAYFTRGSGHSAAAVYTENPAAYQEVTNRLTKKWETARTLVPAPIVTNSEGAAGVLYYGPLDNIVDELKDLLKDQMTLNTCRVRALPFSAEVRKFIEANQKVFVVDQNRDGQMFQLLAMEYPELANKLVSLKYHSGLPMNAENLRKDFAHAISFFI
ncbi:2-oxoacid:acceptor oxidoreductase subunit alpha [Bdellovibrio sp.]|uniref:2-oxoacid:acceptor oxidoreductase subunit alpha n=1 Tax=Bdellovibrio sp. TaxID=28201 RepID=UPI0039E52B82